MNEELVVRRGVLQDCEDFGNLVSLSAASLLPAFGRRAVAVLKSLFCCRRNLFSFEHSCFVEISGRSAGMVLSYDWRTERQQRIRTGLLLIKNMKIEVLTKLPLILKVNSVSGRVGIGDYYISNIAVYPEYREMGLGEALMSQVEKQARAMSLRKIVLDVEADNQKAVGFYSKCGYVRVGKLREIIMSNNAHTFCRMTKPIFTSQRNNSSIPNYLP